MLKVFESYEKETKILEWLHKYDRSFSRNKYSTTPNGVVDVVGNVNINSNKLETIPIQFGKITGDFNCADNQLVSLFGSPTEVGEVFCCQMNQLRDFKYAPDAVGGGVHAFGNFIMVLPTLKIGGKLEIYDNPVFSLFGEQLMKELILPNLYEFNDSEIVYKDIDDYYFNGYAFLNFIKDHIPNQLSTYKKNLPAMIERAEIIRYLIA
jgi:hypothetical protein